ncbi:FAD-dependent monooxygenase [Pleomorphomonas sp. JP5]|uniref:FAD-dependent monooxygenase n=1 Tax=Pleomorphomonas sp. JP5 TaxID=2942998 RepID=UPI002044458E|nr:FAD-dependent monooxygenase [Pleomorphomonas sp. JP5]MCM5560036.1 FAD-dependent monooxygenase [Pleomorphomonas sp. JP5]
MPDHLPVVVVGAGIAGLTLSLCLARAGVRVIVIDKAQELREVGAGLQLSPNASSILFHLGLGSALDATGIRPEAVSIRDGASGRLIVRMPLGEAMVERYGAPYIVIHRADLQGTLLAAVEQEPRVTLHLGVQISSIDVDAAGVVIEGMEADQPVRFEGSVLVGADGVRSTVRETVVGGGPARYTGRTAWRATFKAEGFFAQSFRHNETGLWLGRHAHLVHYAIDAGREINLVAAIDDAWNEDGWDVSGDPAQIQAAFEGWPEPARKLIAMPDSWRKWALCEAPRDTPWTKGRTVLIGDAVHGMPPFVAQGAAMAIEDARVLAGVLASGLGDDVEDRLGVFAEGRKARTDKVAAAARRNGVIYHLGGVPAKARNLGMRLIGAERLADNMDWIYGWRPLEG